MREAEAELNRVKLQVTQKVVGQQREIAACKANLQLAQTDFARMQALSKSGGEFPKKCLGAAKQNCRKSEGRLGTRGGGASLYFGVASQGQTSVYGIGVSSRR